MWHVRRRNSLAPSNTATATTSSSISDAVKSILTTPNHCRYMDLTTNTDPNTNLHTPQTPNNLDRTRHFFTSYQSVRYSDNNL